jgi:hypothetical protein
MGHKDTMEYAAVFMVGKYTVSDKVPTARTNGIDCEYGNAFIMDMSDFACINTVYGSYFDENTAPARETVQVAGLPKGVNVEISMVAVK